MRIIDSDTLSPSAELEARIGQHHRGLTCLMLRRKGRQAFSSVQLEGPDGSSVGGKETPKDKPADVSRAVWEQVTAHAARVGAGSYQVELVFAAGERGPAPKPVVVELAVGEDGEECGHGTDPSVVVDLCLRVATFMAGTLRQFFEVLPKIASETTLNMAEVRKLNESTAERLRAMSDVSDRVTLARIEAEASNKRVELAREFIGPGLKALGMNAPMESTMRTAAAVKPAPASSTDAEREVNADLERVVTLGAKLSSSLTDSQLANIRVLLGDELTDRLASLRTNTEAAAVLNLVADTLALGRERGMGLLAQLSNEQVTTLEAIHEAGDRIAASEKVSA
jgi:hypothetical protein